MPIPVRFLESPPVVGLFHSLGLPAGLPDDVAEAKGTVRLRVGRESGTFRRPFDPDDVTHRGAEAMGWRPLGDRSAAWGRVVVDDAVFGNAGFASFAQPYGSSPLVLADTTQPRMRRARALLEGAMGWRFGAWRIGLAGGMDMREDATRDVRFVRTARDAVPAVAVTVARRMPAGLMLALHGRWTGGSETVILRPEPGGSRAYLFDGLNEPAPRDIAPPNAFFRRNQRDAFAGGVALSGGLFGGRWAVSAARTYRRDGHFTLLQRDPPTDTWVADGWTGRAAFHHEVGARLAATLSVEADRLVGDVTLADIEGVIVRVRETRMGASLDLRWTPRTPRWRAAVRMGVHRAHRRIDDFLVRVESDLEVWRPSAAAGVAWTVHATTFEVAVGAGASGPYATLPNPASMGPVYNAFVAPALARDATRSYTVAGALGVRHYVTERLGFSGHATYARSGTRGTIVPPGPAGHYGNWVLELGVIIGR